MAPGDRGRPTSGPPALRRPLGPQLFALLVAIKGGSRYGYGLLHEVQQLTGGYITLSSATLYRSLRRMRSAGLIEELLEDDAAVRGSPRRGIRRHEYRVTPLGHQAAQAEAERLTVLVRAAERHGLIGPGAAGERSGQKESPDDHPTP